MGLREACKNHRTDAGKIAGQSLKREEGIMEDYGKGNGGFLSENEIMALEALGCS